MPIPFNSGEFVLGRGSLNYQVVLDDFPKAKQVRVLTYNISKKNYRNELINALKGIPENADVKIISNIPSRMQNYYNTPAGNRMRENYRESFTTYIERLNPENFPSNPYVGFNFTNHAKIIGTENVVYIGSANYSDESKDNIESGTIIRDKGFIQKLYTEVFPTIIDESTPYFEDDFNVLRLFVISMEQKFRAWLTRFDEELISVNANTKIRSLWQNFRFDENDFYELAADIDELSDFMTLLDNTYSEEDEEYNKLIEKIEKRMANIQLDWMQEFMMIDSDFYEFIRYDEEEKVHEYLQDDPDAYDENLDACIESAMDKARDEYEDRRFGIENEFLSLRDAVEKIINILTDTHEESLKFSDKWIAERLDNT